MASNKVATLGARVACAKRYWRDLEKYKSSEPRADAGAIIVQSSAAVGGVRDFVWAIELQSTCKLF